MLYTLEPGDDLTGGPWYTDDKVLDEAFVDALLNVVFHHVDKKSFPPPSKINHPDGTIEKLPRYYHPTYRGYATAEDVYEYIINSKVITDEQIKETFGVSHVHKLLEVLCYSNMIQKRTDGVTYRTVRGDEEVQGPEERDVYYEGEEVKEEEEDVVLGHKGYTEAPCGRCPVFKICGNLGNDVSAANCVYWDEWTTKITEQELF
jgi:DNA-directed RNA polymerase III subunit RPC6